ncbi:MAG: starch-binding protein [Prevotellaceae bacterium]|jgi:hypothetical protein|nr:starch-binding protein [Prevotellaceae bacterium]
MKHIIKYFHLSLLIVLCSLFLTNCETYQRQPQGEIVPTAPVLKIAQNNVWLRDSNEVFTDKFLVRINWTEARFTYKNGVAAEVGNLQYILEMDTADFIEPTVLATTQYLYADLFSAPLREQLMAWYGGEIDTTKYIMFRVKTLCNNISEPIYSNVFGLRIDPTKPEDEIVVTPTIPEVTIRLKKAAECTWANVWVYAWGTTSDAEIYGGWGGQKLTADENGWYEFVVAGIRPINLILNNGSGGNGNQFDFTNANLTDGGCYEITNSSATEIGCE